MRPRFRHVSLIWASDWGLTIFLVLIAVTVFIFMPMSGQSETARLLTEIVFALVLVSGVAAVSERRTMTLFAAGLVIVTIALRGIAHLMPGPVILPATAISTLACLGLLAGVVLIQVFRKGPITSHRIQGAIAVYLLLGLMWGVTYDFVFLEIPGAFQPADLADASESAMTNLVYFSFVTLTTVGYGDITPAHAIVRSLSNLEALVGQLYPAILIGRLVAMELSSRQSKSREP